MDSISKQSSKSTSVQKLPEISLRQKIQMFHQRWEKQVVRHLPKYDRSTIENVYQVSEFCPAIQLNMLQQEKKWQMKPRYMEKQLKINEKIRSTLVDWLI
mmetsp:Transcript_15586/g.26327  ORF Transcript_15586/g.26327 Transcript_15586/m.26327 type:complete len:100 (+) Transcript_15586:264-563(+)